MPNVGDFHHMILEVSDLDRSERFYRDVLGFAALGRDLWPGEGRTATFRTDEGHHVVLAQVAEVKRDESGVHYNFTLSPEYWQEVAARLKREGVKLRDFEHRDEQRSEGEVSMSFWDPDGHRLQFAAYSEDVWTVPAARRGKIMAGRIEDFAVGSVTYNREGKFFLVRLADGFLALNEICTHMHCHVTYQPEHYRFYCPCHYRKFTRQGEQIEVKADVPPLHMYRLEFVDGQVVVDTDATIARQPDEVERMYAPPAIGSRGKPSS